MAPGSRTIAAPPITDRTRLARSDSATWSPACGPSRQIRKAPSAAASAMNSQAPAGIVPIQVGGRIVPTI